MSTITDFILARVAEDERAAHYAMTRDPLNDRDTEGWWIGHYQHYTRHDPARVVAQCEAIRRVVLSCSEMQMSGVEMAAYLATQTIRTLALAHADHPDFREDWR